MTAADTSVPEGFVYGDIHETHCVKGLYGEGISETIERFKVLGYTANREPYGWNVELYLQAEEDAPPKRTKDTWRWIIPIK